VKSHSVKEFNASEEAVLTSFLLGDLSGISASLLCLVIEEKFGHAKGVGILSSDNFTRFKTGESVRTDGSSQLRWISEYHMKYGRFVWGN
jgi:hypothetical protein